MPPSFLRFRPIALLASALVAALAACQESFNEPQRHAARSARPRASVGPLQAACSAQFPAQPASSRYGIVGNWGQRNVNTPVDPITNTTYGQIATLYRQANVGWVRVNFDWGGVLALNAGGPDTNALDFTTTDAAVASASCRGVNILGTIAYTPRWAVKRSVSYPNEYNRYLPDSLRYWEAAVRRIVNRYPQIRYWSIWNEPNAIDFFRGQNDGTDADRIRDYNTLLGRAAPHIVGNVDAQGRRYLVALELAGVSATVDQPWVRGVLNGPYASSIDVVAYHKYGDYTAIRDRASSLVAENSGAISGGWRWPIWVTEAGPTGCISSRYVDRIRYSFCTGDSAVYMRDDYLAGQTQGVLSATNQTSAASQWGKTFPWHSHLDIVFNATARRYEGDDRGLLLGAFSNQIRGRPAFTAYASVASPLGVRGSASYASNQNVTVTATPAVPSSYYYVWEYLWCYNGNAAGDCDGQWHPYTAGQDVTSIAPYVYKQDYYVYTRVWQYAWQNGPQIGSGEWDITGPGTCTVSTGCGGGGGGMLSTPSTTTAERRKGRKGANNK